MWDSVLAAVIMAGIQIASTESNSPAKARLAAPTGLKARVIEAPVVPVTEWQGEDVEEEEL